MTALLEATGVVKRFGGLVAVDHVDLSIAPGEIVGLIGPNGSGKTTLFDCLSCVQRADSGEVRFDGVDVTRRAPHQIARGGISRTFQIIRVYGALTVRENIELSASWAGIGVRRMLSRTDPATRCRADQLIEFLSLGPLRDERADTLSGGQRRLAEIGMALMSEPRLILLDEATSGVNPTLINEIRDRLAEVNSTQGVALFLVEHNVQFIAELCQRVVVLDQGHKLAEGTPAEIMNNPEVIEAYFGAAPGAASHRERSATTPYDASSDESDRSVPSDDVEDEDR